MLNMTTTTPAPLQGEMLWERQLYETEQPLDQEKAEAIQEAENIVKTAEVPDIFQKAFEQDNSVGFSGSGSINFADSTTTSSAIDLSPALNSVTSSASKAGETITTVANEVWDVTKGIVTESISANVELWDIISGTNDKKAAQDQDPKKQEKLAEGRWIRQQNKDRSDEVRNVSLDRMRQMAMEALRISDGQITMAQVEGKANPNVTLGVKGNETKSASIGLNTVFDVWRGFREQKDAAQKAEDNKTVTSPGKNLSLNLNAHEGQATIIGPNAAPG